MASVLLAALAGMGAAAHAHGVARTLREHGHRVSVVTAEWAVEPFRRDGFEVHPVPELPMPDLTESLPPVAQRARQVLVRVQQNIVGLAAEQWEVVERVLRDAAVDVVVTDPLFIGASMLAVRPRSERPAVVMLGFFPPWIPDPNVPPYGMGFSPTDDGAGDRVRAALFGLLAARAFSVLSRSFNAKVERIFGVPLRGDLRSTPALADAWAQLTVPRFEYPRSALPPNFRFIGPLRPPADEPIPEWWDPDRDDASVVAVRAAAFGGVEDLILPSLAAFGGGEHTVVVAGVSRDGIASRLTGPLPDNVHFEERLPWARLSANRTVVVSDGDYLHTQHALRMGIPVVVAGTLETDVETAARVAWAGAGLDLRTRQPSPAQLAAAVARIRADPSYRAAAARIAAQIATMDAEERICELVEQHAVAAA